MGKLKSTTDEKDDLHIYKINCRGINGETSFVVKTLTEACKLAIKMDKNQQKEGELSAMVYERTYRCHAFTCQWIRLLQCGHII